MSVTCTVVGLAACASTGQPGATRASDSPGLDGATVYRRALGNFAESDLRREVTRVFNRHAYTIRRIDPAPAIYVLSEWKSRLPLDDERRLGVTDIETVLSVRGRVRRGPTAVTYYASTFYAENRARFGASGEWVPLPVTEDFAAYAGEIAQRLRFELESLQRD